MAAGPGQPPVPPPGGAPPGRPPAEPPPPPDPEPIPEPPPRRRPPRHRRHRDLPARVRRRQAIGALLVGGLAVAGGYLLLVDGSDDEKGKETPLAKLVGQTVIGRMGPDGPDKDMLRRARRGELGGVIALPRSAGSLRRDAASLQAAAEAGGNPPLIIAIDQEGGPVKRLPGPPETSPAELGEAGEPEAARIEGEETGRYLAGLGVNVDLAPVADVRHTGAPATLADRTFATDPEVVGTLAGAFAEGLQDGGVLPTVKHFPGLGLARENPDAGPVTIGASAETLETELIPFERAIEAGMPLVMLSTAIYPSLGSREPAAWAESIVGGELRDRIGFDGACITDDLESNAVRAALDPDQAARRALLAGCDLVLFAKTEAASQRAFESLLRAARRNELPRETLEQANERIAALKDALSGSSNSVRASPEGQTEGEA